MKEKAGVWADICVVDGIDLEAWLEDHEAVGVRYATQVLKTIPPEGVYSADAFWRATLREREEA